MPTPDETATPAAAPDPRQLVRHLAVLSDVARIASASLSLDDVLAQVMDAVDNLFAPQDWSVLLVDEADGSLRFALAMGQAASKLAHLRVARGEGVAGWVAEHDRPAVIPDVESDLRFSGRFDQQSGFQTRSLVALPLRSRGRVVGVMELCNVLEGRELGESELDLLRIVCEYAGVAVDNATIHGRVVELSRSDPLTGLLNSTAFGEEVEAAAGRSRTTGEVFSVLFFDVDDFKRVVDGHGHLEGSRVLAEMGRRLGAHLGSDDCATRFGGDEFAVLLPGQGRAGAHRWAASLLEALRDAPYDCAAGQSVRVTLSMGLASYPEDGRTAAELMKASDVAMYAVKHSGKDGARAAGA
jgi:diguanylate cyclase (GGDEF)-like protein